MILQPMLKVLNLIKLLSPSTNGKPTPEVRSMLKVGFKDEDEEKIHYFAPLAWKKIMSAFFGKENYFAYLKLVLSTVFVLEAWSRSVKLEIDVCHKNKKNY